MSEIHVLVTMQVPDDARPNVVGILRSVFGIEATVEEARKCGSCDNFFVPRNIADPPGDCPTCDIQFAMPEPRPGDRCQLLGDGYVRHWKPCDDSTLPDGSVTHLRDGHRTPVSQHEAEIAIKRWIDQHN